MPLQITRTTVKLGVKTPFSLLHVTDTHLCRAYESEGEFLVRLAAERAKNCFVPESEMETLFEDALRYAKEHGETVAFTGDIYDFLSQANFDYFDEKTKDLDYIYAAGNHDFCTAPGADKEDHAFKLAQLKRVAPHIRDDLLFSSRIVNGEVNLVTMDDSYYQFTEGQRELLMAEAARGLPIILFLHVPLYTPRFGEHQLTHEPAVSLTGAPDALFDKYPDGRGNTRFPTSATRRTVDYITHEPLIKAIFAGHTHGSFEEPLSNGVMQYTTGGTFNGTVREIVVE